MSYLKGKLCKQVGPGSEFLNYEVDELKDGSFLFNRQQKMEFGF